MEPVEECFFCDPDEPCSVCARLESGPANWEQTAPEITQEEIDRANEDADDDYDPGYEVPTCYCPGFGWMVI